MPLSATAVSSTDCLPRSQHGSPTVWFVSRVGSVHCLSVGVINVASAQDISKLSSTTVMWPPASRQGQLEYSRMVPDGRRRYLIRRWRSNGIRENHHENPQTSGFSIRLGDSSPISCKGANEKVEAGNIAPQLKLSGQRLLMPYEGPVRRRGQPFRVKANRRGGTESCRRQYPAWECPLSSSARTVQRVGGFK
jgi:hypothetical protein